MSASLKINECVLMQTYYIMFMLSNYLCLSSAWKVLDKLYSFLFNSIFLSIIFFRLCTFYFILKMFIMGELVAFVVLKLVFNVLSIGLPYFASIVWLLCSLSGWLHLNCSSIDTGFMLPKPIVKLHVI